MKTLWTIFSVFMVITLYGQQYAQIDAGVSQVKYKGDYNTLAENLTREYDDDISKARAIFSWLAQNINYDHKRRDKMRNRSNNTRVVLESEEAALNYDQTRIDNAINEALTSRKGVCQDYAWIFQAMSNHVGLECAFVTGYARISPRSIGQVRQKSNHAWNAIKLNDKWHHIDVTWSTGMGSNEDYGDGFFMVDPEIFIYSHFPEDDKWQLLDQTISRETFANLPFTYSAFIKHKVRSFSPAMGRISKTDIIELDMDIDQGESLVIIKGNKVSKYKFESADNIHRLDIGDTRLVSNVTIGIMKNNSAQPVLTFKVSAI